MKTNKPQAHCFQALCPGEAFWTLGVRTKSGRPRAGCAKAGQLVSATQHGHRITGCLAAVSAPMECGSPGVWPGVAVWPGRAVPTDRGDPGPALRDCSAAWVHL